MEQQLTAFDAIKEDLEDGDMRERLRRVGLDVQSQGQVTQMCNRISDLTAEYRDEMAKEEPDMTGYVQPSASRRSLDRSVGIRVSNVKVADARCPYSVQV